MKIGIVSLYPPKGLKHFKLGGVASYTKNLVDSIISHSKVEVTFFANKLDDKKEIYEEDKAKIIRCYSKNIFYPFQIFWNVIKYGNEINTIHIQHEYFLYGGIFSACLFPFMLLLFRLLRKSVIVTLHGIIPLSKIDENFMKQNNMKGYPSILRLGLFAITKLISFFTTKIIAHENYFKNILTKDYGINKDKIVVIPHGIEERNDLINQEKAKEILGVKGKRVLLFFGYITGYKGLELLIDAFGCLDDKKYFLFIAGGEHPRLKNDIAYQQYVKSLKEKARKISKNIAFTGFVPEEKISLYFSAADLVLFPYKIAMASSGPLNLTFSYKKPFFVSKIFGKSIGINKLTFDDNPMKLAKKISNQKSYNRFFKKVIYLNKINSWEKIGKKHLLLYKNEI